MLIKKTASLAQRMHAIDVAEHKRASVILKRHGFNPPAAVPPIEDYERRFEVPDWRRVLADREDVAAGKKPAPKDAEAAVVDVDKLKRARGLASRVRVLVEAGASFEDASKQALKEAEAAPDETDDEEDDSIEAQARRGREIIRRTHELTRAGSPYADAHARALEESRQGKRRTVAVRVTHTTPAAQRAGLGREQHAAATKQLERQRGVTPARAAELLSDSVDAANDATETALLRRVGVNLAGHAGRNQLERVMSFIRSQPDGAHLSYDDVHAKACELVRAARVAS